MKKVKRNEKNGHGNDAKDRKTKKKHVKTTVAARLEIAQVKQRNQVYRTNTRKVQLGVHMCVRL